MAPLKDSISLDVSGLTGSAEGVWAGMLHQELKKKTQSIFTTLTSKLSTDPNMPKKNQINKQKKRYFFRMYYFETGY